MCDVITILFHCRMNKKTSFRQEQRNNVPLSLSHHLKFVDSVMSGFYAV